MNFFDSLNSSAQRLIEHKDVLRVISHLDADGITSAAIMTNALKRANFNFSVSIVKQLSEEVLIELNLAFNEPPQPDGK